MRTFAIKTLGCKVNQYESQQVRELLESHGLEQTSAETAPDLVVINTCCVTHVASAKSRQLTRKTKKTNPHSVVVVAGCLPAGQTEELKGLEKQAIIVEQKDLLVQTLKSLLANSTEASNRTTTGSRTLKSAKIKHKNDSKNAETPTPNKSTSHETNDSELPDLKSYKGQTRAFLKIQDGCDGFCTYCIIPKIRNKISSKPSETILQEARDLVYAGHKEIVLTGIFLGAYGQETVRRRKWEKESTGKLPELLDKIAQIQGLERLRLSSLEPGDVTEELLEVMCKHDNITHHLHLPLQSGSGRVLKRMCRQYNEKEFIAAIDLLCDRLDRPAITTDIIVGFPGETDSDFQATLNMAEYARFAKIHVFSFSERQNTPAVKMRPKIASDKIKYRSQELRELDSKLQLQFRQQFAGTEMRMIVENAQKQTGRTDRYFEVQIKDNRKYETGELVTGFLSKDAQSLQVIA
ncbi:Threonylcarbamoyladenosine tRNA methylthiotransferase MtaB [Anaerohalosphaera lusitana]|uniref:Threonylcarbamoyladenosine tRNA methylthiotransferase MtaB n=1 Tax=Anaerohalosphaera lusitana TaxID=1936003 RepID=A0A1U9NL99_9BACT|nr:tRNA (N(6)-L-threonylcarbamoyladenosine(37)-C(2))-methylthiotransferase MtaB [Anaerohalosphaera lusitana]AQT68605.1 Threonylcarbamoyladenosine tRNA methylthiotransferase MtaB [Anaerohalosphaera lusitana]